MSLTMRKQGVYCWRKTIDDHPLFQSTKTDDPSEKRRDGHHVGDDRRHESHLGAAQSRGRGWVVFSTKRMHNNHYKWVSAACARAGVDVNLGKVRLHTCRHTDATRLLQGGLNIMDLQGQLGHAALSSTMVYLHIKPTVAAEKAAGILNKATA